MKPSKRIGVAALALASALAASVGHCGESPAVSAAGPCSVEQASPTGIVAIEQNFDMLTDDGRRIALAGVEFPNEPELRERSRARLSAWLAADRLVFLALGSSAPDRWGRFAAGLFVVGEGADAPLVSAGEAALRSGLARFRPDEAVIACRNRLLTAERQARELRLGLWANDAYVVIDAGRRDALLDRKGMVLVEGVVSGIGEAGGSLYLNFGPRRGADFAVVIWKRNLETFERAGAPPRMLVGRRVRVRGLIDTRFGPRMEIATPAEIEIVDASLPR